MDRETMTEAVSIPAENTASIRLGRWWQLTLGVICMSMIANLHAPRMHEGRRFLVPAALEQASHRGNRTDPIEIFAARRREREHRMIPRSVGLLRQRQRQRGTLRKRECCNLIIDRRRQLRDFSQ